MRAPAGTVLDLGAGTGIFTRACDRTARPAAKWIRTMRHADSLPLAFSDEEIAAGIQHLEAYPAQLALGPSRIPLLAFRAVD